MIVGLLLVTHGAIGQVLLDSAVEVLNVQPLPARVLATTGTSDPVKSLSTAEGMLAELDSGAGVLVLTDLYGSTASNIACRLREHSRVRVVTGINLPMLIRVLNYPELDLETLQQKALSGGRDGVLSCSSEDRTHAG